MAKLTKRELEEIIRKQRPKHRLVSEPDDTRSDPYRAPAEASTPDIETLRKKFLGENYDVDARTVEGAGDDEDDSQAVVVEEVSDEEGGDQPTDRGSKKRVAIISTKKKKIIGEQG
jgi:hypothetical protein